MGAGAFDQGETLENVAQAGAVDVHDVQGRAGDGRRSDHFADLLNGGAGLEAARAAGVGVDRHSPLGGETEHVNHLQSSGSGSVLDSHSNGQAAGVQLRAQALADSLDLLGGGGLVGRWAALGQDFAGGKRGSEYQGSRRGVAGGGAVVNQRVAFLGFQELGYVGHADFQFERGGDTVKRLDALAGEVLAVLMQIDESGSDHQAAGMDDAPSG